MPVSTQKLFHGVAVDAGSGLDAMIRDARGETAKPGDLVTFKRCVLKALGPNASTVLLDATCGPDLLDDYPDNCDLMLAFEADVYKISDTDRITILPDNFTVGDYPSMGVNQLKFFMYYSPDDDCALNTRKQDIVEKIGRECKALGIRFLMEPLVYHPTIKAGTSQYAKIKPELVRRATQKFADPRFNADVLKVEIPVDLNFVAGFGQPDMTRPQALAAFRDAAQPAKDCELVYLSAGVTFDWFEASLRMAIEAGVEFSGFMCGRAIWSDAIGVFGRDGEAALNQWLLDTGTRRLKSLIATLG
jgi:tagatose 1,6-diphosphate aldolase